MIAGYGVCLYYLITTQFYGAPLWFGIKNISCGLFGIPVAFLVTWLVSLVTPAPSREMQDFIDSIRVPRGKVAVMAGQQRSEEHTSELQSLMRISYAVFCLKKKKHITQITRN